MAHTDVDGNGATAADARNRALRTFLWGLAIDVTFALSSVLGVAMGEIHWTKAYWLALGGLLLKTALTAAVSYAMRHLAPPKAQ